jgi:vacuolar-type H+-ATPase subunit I/STV1
MNFTKKNLPEAKGFQKTKYDKLLEHFVEPGDSLFFDELDLSKPAASQAAKRLMILDPTRKFHSFYNVIEKKVVIRVRPAGEVIDKEEEKEQEEEQKEPETYEQMVEREKRESIISSSPLG